MSAPTKELRRLKKFLTGDVQNRPREQIRKRQRYPNRFTADHIQVPSDNGVLVVLRVATRKVAAELQPERPPLTQCGSG